jgi:hypothetical protein
MFKKSEEKLISLALMFCALLIFLLYLLNYSELSAKSNQGLNLLSKRSTKQLRINSSPTSHQLKTIIYKPEFALDNAKQLNIKPSVLWQAPNARYVLYEMNKSLSQEREEKVLEHLTQIELRRNSRLKKAFKVYNAAPLKRFFYLIGGVFSSNAQINNNRGACEYISKIRLEQLKLVKEYIGFFSSDLNLKNIEASREKEVIETISRKYDFQTLNYINHLYSRFPYYYEAKNNRNILSADGNLEDEPSLENGIIQQSVFENHPAELYLNYGRILLISLDGLTIKTFLVSDESLVKIYKLNTSVLAIQSLRDKGFTKLMINTEEGLLGFNLNIGKTQSPDFSLHMTNRIDSLGIKAKELYGSYKLKTLANHAVSVNSLLTIKLKSRISGLILASNAALLEFKHLVDSQDDQFLRIFLLKTKNSVGVTDIVVPTEKVVYKFTLEVNKAGLRSEINEIILD